MLGIPPPLPAANAPLLRLHFWKSGMADASHVLVRQAGLVAAEDTAFFTEQKPAELRRGSNGRQFSLAYQLGAIRAFNLFIFPIFYQPVHLKHRDFEMVRGLPNIPITIGRRPQGLKPSIFKHEIHFQTYPSLRLRCHHRFSIRPNASTHPAHAVGQYD